MTKITMTWITRVLLVLVVALASCAHAAAPTTQPPPKLGAEHFSNTAQSTLVSGMGVADSTLTVAVPTRFPAPQFRIIVDGEFMIVTGVAGSTFTVTRAAEGSLASTHAAGAVVSHVITAGGLGSALAAIGAATYGSGDDSATFNGVATNSFSTLGGSTYALNRDVYLADGTTVQAGVTLSANGFKIFGAGTLTIAAGATISADGTNASGATAGGTSNAGTLGVGTAGGNGRASNTGLPGSSQITNNQLGDVNGTGGTGGAGGVNAGGNGGSYTAVPINGGADWVLPVLSGFIFSQTTGGNFAQLYPIGGGVGGGGGGSDNAAATGGGGGGGGGVLVLHAFNLVNNGAIHARGGVGANAFGAPGNAGGGGGGMGGIINTLSRFYSGTGTLDAAGGGGGTGVGTGASGASGSVGHINQMTF